MITTKYLFMYKYRLIDMCIDMSVYTYVYICVQLGNSFGNTKMKKGAHLYIRFQLGNSFGNTKMKKGANLFVFNEAIGSAPHRSGKLSKDSRPLSGLNFI
jgi:hypothetical protein